ncbi:choice-of-anchor D domain-containing protein [Nostoc sp. CHAB 5834]|nr:choice-of-anchor D domain-containing protein [Nostoc sp. CHAB 5834]
MKKSFSAAFLAFLLGASVAPSVYAGSSSYEMWRSVIGLRVTGSPETPPVKYPGEDATKESPLTLLPEELSWSDAFVGTRTQRSVELKNAGAESVRISGTHIVGSGFMADATACPQLLEAGASCLIVVSFAPQSEGSFTGVLSVVGEGFARKTVKLQGNAIAAPLTLSPKFVDLGFINRGAPHFAKVTVSNNSPVPAPLLLRPGGGLGTRLTADVSACGTVLYPAQRCDVTLSVQGTAPLGAFTSEVMLESSGHVYPISVKGFVQDSILELSSSSLSFEDVLKSKTKSMSVLLLNSGNISIPVKSVTVRGSPSLSVEHTCPNPLGAGAACSAKVTFAPVEYGQVSGVLEFVTGEASNTLSTSIAGVGVGASLQANPSSITFTHLAQPSFWKSPQVLATVTNSSSIAAEVIEPKYTGTGTVSLSNDCPASLPGGASCQVSGTFSETSGDFAGNLTVKALGGPVTSVPLSFAVPAPQLSASSAVLSFGERPFGASATLSSIITNTGLFKTQVTTVGIEGESSEAFTAAHDCAELAPGQTCTVSVDFNPKQPVSTGKLKLSYASKQLVVNLEGRAVGPNLKYSPENLALGSLQLGTVSQRVVSVTNTGTAPLTELNADITGSGLTLSNECPSSLSPGQSCGLNVTVTAQELGDLSGRVQISASGGKAVTVPVSARVGQSLLSVSSPLAAFPLTTAVGTTSDPLSILVLNNAQSSEPLTVSSVTLQGSSAFSAVHNCTAIAVAQSCAVEFRFKPFNGEEQIGTATIASPFGDPVTVILKGTGVQSSLAISGSTDLGTIALNASKLVPLTVTNSGNVAHTISTVTAVAGTLSANGCTVGRVLPPGDSCAVSVTPATATLGALGTKVTVATNKGTYVGVVTGNVEALSLTLDATTVEFGTVPLGEVATKYVSFRNSGPDVPLSAVSVVGTGFSLNPADSTCEGVGTTFTIPKDTRCKVAVNYSSTNAVSSTGTFKYTWGGVTREVGLNAQAVSSSYAVSGRATANSAFVATQMLTYEPSEVTGSGTPTTTFDVFLRNLNNTSNSVDVEISGDAGFTIQLLRTTPSSIVSGARDFGVVAGARTGTVTTNSTYPHVGLRVLFTAKDRQPVTSEATVTFTVDNVHKFSRTLTVAGRYNPVANFSIYSTSNLGLATTNVATSLNVGTAIPTVGTVSGTYVNKTIFFGAYKGFGSVKGTLTISGSSDFGFNGQAIAPSGQSLAWFKKLPNGSSNTNRADTSAATVQLISCGEFPTNTTQACALAIDVRLTPTSSGPREAVLTFTPDAFTGLPAQSISLYGQGVSALAISWGVNSHNSTPPASVLESSDTNSYFITGNKPSPSVLVFVKNTGQGVANGKFIVEGAPELYISQTGAYRADGNSSANYSHPAGTRDTGNISGVTSMTPHLLGRVSLDTTQNGIYEGFLTFVPELASGLPSMRIPVKLTIKGYLGPAVMSSSHSAPTPFTNNTLDFGPTSADGTVGLPAKTSLKTIYLKNPGPVPLLQGTFNIESSSPAKFKIFRVSSSNSSGGATDIQGAILPGGIATSLIKSYVNTYESDFRVLINYAPTEISALDEATLVFTPSAGAIALGMPATPLRLSLKGSSDYNVRANGSVTPSAVAAPDSPWDFGAKSVNAQGLPGASSISKKLYMVPSGTAGALAGTFTYSGSPAFTVKNVQPYTPATGQLAGSPVAVGTLVRATHDISSGTNAITGVSAQVDFEPTTLGTHTGKITWTPSDVRVTPLEFTVTGTGANNVTTEFSSAANSSNPISVVDGGIATAKLIPNSYPVPRELPTFFIRNKGTNGSLAGTLSITGPDATSFEIAQWGQSTSTATPTLSATCTITSPQLSANCAAADGSYPSNYYVHLYSKINFKPKRKGAHLATLTFVPHASLGLPSQTVTLQGMGVFDAVGLLSEQPTGGAPATSANVATYVNPPGGLSAGGGTVLKKFFVQASGIYGYVGGAFSISGATSFKIFQTGISTATGFSSANGTVQPGGLTGTALSPNEPSVSSTNYSGLYVVVQYSPTAAGESSAVLTYTPDVATGLPSQSVNIAGRASNDFIGNITWTGSRDGSAPAPTNFGQVGITLDKVFYLTAPAANFGSMGGTVSVEGARFNLQAVQLINLNSAESVVQNYSTDGRTAAGIRIPEWSSNPLPVLLRVTVRANTDSSGNQLTGSLTFTPLSTAYGSSMSIGLIADTVRP